jgi:short-subunit dehydrogenase
VSTARPVALVTGASAGIGRSFTMALADRGHDLVLVARDAARLEALGKELHDAYGASSEVLAADLSDGAQLRTVEARLADRERPVDVLVNNAGFGTYGHFADLPIDREEQEIRLNVLALTRLTHAALPGMIERGRGGVLNVASIAGYQPTPLNATYGATKAFVCSFTEALHEELKGTGVRCTVLSPGFTRTEFQERAGIDSGDIPGFLWQEPGPVVQGALRAFEAGKASYVPGLLNATTAAASAALPSAVTRRIASLVIKRAEK